MQVTHHLATVAYAQRKGIGIAGKTPQTRRGRDALNRIDLAQPSPAPSTSP